MAIAISSEGGGGGGEGNLIVKIVLNSGEFTKSVREMSSQLCRGVGYVDSVYSVTNS